MSWMWLHRVSKPGHRHRFREDRDPGYGFRIRLCQAGPCQAMQVYVDRAAEKTVPALAGLERVRV